MRRIVVGFSGGVTSAWCAGWALRTFPRDEVVLLFHDTKEEDPDTYRFLHEMATKLDHPITERSDGRSLTELIYDEGMIPSNRAPFCSRMLKTIPSMKYMKDLTASGVSTIIKVYGFSAMEPDRIQRHTAMGWQHGFECRFPLVEEKVSKQEAYTWAQCEMGVEPPRMYAWSEHANCPGCFRGGKAYWLAVKEHAPEVWEQRKALEIEFGHRINNRYSLVQIEQEGMRGQGRYRESIDIGPCECGS